MKDIEFKFSTGFDESKSPRAGFIKRDPKTSDTLETAVMTGPNIFVANPASKRPNQPCKSKGDFSPCDLTNPETCPDDFFPATVYQCTPKGLKSNEYNTKTPWGNNHCDQFRLLARRMVNTTGARTLSATIIPPGPSHVDAISSLSFQNTETLTNFTSLSHSLMYDYISRVLSGGTLGQGIFNLFPYLSIEQTQNFENTLIPALQVRGLRLNTISSYYKELWKECFNNKFKEFYFDSKFSPTICYHKLTNKWQRDTCIRDPHQREQALCEIDAIVAILFGFDEDTLIKLYRSQFGVLQNNLQDRVGQEIDLEKFHFPREQQMREAYQYFAQFAETKPSKTYKQKQNQLAEVAS
jgi:hypothetical protein